MVPQGQCEEVTWHRDLDRRGLSEGSSAKVRQSQDGNGHWFTSSVLEGKALLTADFKSPWSHHGFAPWGSPRLQLR